METFKIKLLTLSIILLIGIACSAYNLYYNKSNKFTTKVVK